MLETIGYDAATAASFAPWDAADASVGRVVRVDRGVLGVLTEAGPHRVTLGGALLGLVAQEPARAPCLGDWVVVRSWPDRRETVEHVLPRRTALVQGYGDPRHQPVLAANVDLVGVVVDRAPAGPRTAGLSRLLDLAVASGAGVLVIRAGSGLPPVPAPLVEVARSRGAHVLPVDVGTGAGLPRLRALIDGHLTLALVTSTARVSARVARALVGADVLGAARQRRGLAPLPGGGAVLDLGHPDQPAAPVTVTR